MNKDEEEGEKEEEEEDEEKEHLASPKATTRLVLSEGVKGLKQKIRREEGSNNEEKVRVPRSKDPRRDDTSNKSS